MTPPRRDGLLRRLGRALRATNAIEYGRPVPVDDPPPGAPTSSLVVDQPSGSPAPAGPDGDDARTR